MTRPAPQPQDDKEESKSQPAPTRERIIETALRLFSQKGYLGTATREIAAEAGVAEVTLFRHFPSKESLFEAVFSTYTFLPLLKELMPSIKTMPYEKALAEIARRFLETLTLRKDLVKILHSECHLYPEKIRSIYFAFITEMMQTLAGFFVERQKKGDLKAFDAVLAARAFLGMFYSFFTTKEVIGLGTMDKFDENQVIDNYIKIFSRGTKK